VFRLVVAPPIDHGPQDVVQGSVGVFHFSVGARVVRARVVHLNIEALCNQLHSMIGNGSLRSFEGRGGLWELVKNVECELVSRLKARTNNTNIFLTHPSHDPNLLKLCTPL